MQMRTSDRSRAVLRWSGVLLVYLGASCTASGTDTGNPFAEGPRERIADDYVSDSTFGSPPGQGQVGIQDPTTDIISVPAGTPGGVNDTPALVEADLVIVEGDLLFALAPGWLTIMELAPGSLEVLGRLPIHGDPVEMVLNGYVLWIVVDSPAVTEPTSDGGMILEARTRTILVDVSDPTSPRIIGEQTAPGVLEETRQVGDLFFVVTHRAGSCFECASPPGEEWVAYGTEDQTLSYTAAGTTVTSFAPDSFAPDGGTLELKDQVHLADPRVVSMNAERMYLGVQEMNGFPLSTSGETDVQLVDISDPSGVMRLGTRVPIAGGVRNRWQIDEQDGVLRVITQRPSVGADAPLPVVQTFQVTSVDDAMLMGEAELPIPPSERLLSVRYDGDRGYAITALVQQIVESDPLYTIDLSDPNQPSVLGELEMPGWVYHLEPMGDRLLGIGYENGNQVHISLFDVTDLATPTMIQRDYLPAAVYRFPEIQGKIHKALEVDQAAGIALLPLMTLAGLAADGNFPGAVQMIHFDDTQLELGVNVVTSGPARRAFFDDGEMVTISTQRAQRFDVSDPASPFELARVPLERRLNDARLNGDRVVRWLAADLQDDSGNWVASERIESVDSDTLSSFESPGLLAPRWPFGEQRPGSIVDFVTEHRGYSLRSTMSEAARSSANATNVTVAANVPGTTAGGVVEPPEEGTWLRVVDFSTPEAPRFIGDFELPLHYWPGAVGVLPSARRWLVTGNTFVLVEADRAARELALGESSQVRYSVIDLSAEVPALVAQLDAPGGGPGGELWSRGSMVYTTRSEELDGRRVRHVLDRIDLSDPMAPVLLPPLTVPGAVKAIALTEERLFTIEHELVEPATAPSSQQICNPDCLALAGSVNVVAVDEEGARRLFEMPIASGTPVDVAVSRDQVVVTVRRTEGGEQPTTRVWAQLFSWGDDGLEFQSEAQFSGGELVSLGDGRWSTSAFELLDGSTPTAPTIHHSRSNDARFTNCWPLDSVGAQMLSRCWNQHLHLFDVASE